MGIATENLIRQAIEQQTKAIEALLAEVRTLNQQVAWQNQRLAAQDAGRQQARPMAG